MEACKYHAAYARELRILNVIQLNLYYGIGGAQRGAPTCYAMVCPPSHCATRMNIWQVSAKTSSREAMWLERAPVMFIYQPIRVSAALLVLITHPLIGDKSKKSIILAFSLFFCVILVYLFNGLPSTINF